MILVKNLIVKTYSHFIIVAKSTLNDIGTEELAHLEMVGSMVYQLTKGVPSKELEKAGLGAHYTDHDHAFG